MCTQLAMQSRTSYTQKDAQLLSLLSVLHNHKKSIHIARMTYAPRSPSCPTKVSIQAYSGKQHELRSTRTWILCTTLGALVVPGHALDQFLQRALVAHLLPLVHHARHDDRVRQSLSQGDCSQYPKLGEGGGAGEKRSLTYAGVEKRATGRAR